MGWAGRAAASLAALEFLDRLTESDFEVERVRAVDERRAISLLHAHADKDFSLCDALSFVVMERLGIAEALGFRRPLAEIAVCYRDATTCSRNRVVERVHGRLVTQRQPLPVGVHGKLDARVAELTLHVRGTLALLDQERGVGMPIMLISALPPHGRPRC
jgi:hypothetical protein